MDTRIQEMLEEEMKERNYPDFESGDTIRVKTREEIGGQMRPRSFEGVCIGRQGKGPDQTFKVRKTSFGVGIERIFPLYAPIIEGIEIVRKGKVRRSQLTYLEGRSQKDSRIKQQRVDLQEVNRVESMESEAEEVSEEDIEESEESVEEQGEAPDEAVEDDSSDEDADEAPEASDDPEEEADEVDADDAEEDEENVEEASASESDEPEAAEAETDEETADEEAEKEEVGESV